MAAVSEAVIQHHSLFEKLSMQESIQEPSSSTSDVEEYSESLPSDTEPTDLPSSDDLEAQKHEAQRAALARHIQLKKQHEQEQSEQVATTISIPAKVAKDSDSVRIIDKVRDYQQELFERAKEENVIAV